MPPHHQQSVTPGAEIGQIELRLYLLHPGRPREGVSTHVGVDGRS
jgi:hypothetical protein